MEASHQLILAGAALVAFSILLGQLSTRFGAPLLLVFLAIGMLAGEDGPGGILFSDYGAAFVIGSLALAVILFDGGLRTSRDTLRLALGPATVLASAGVVITALLVGLVAALLLDVSWPAALLIGSIVASTDAAAVFALLRLKGMDVQRRTAATLEAESGLNDPIAIFLTVLFTEYLIAAEGPGIGEVVLRLVLQMGGGAIIGVAGGYLLTRLINRISLAAGLYPILALSLALVIFGGALAVGASGFLAVYVAGVVLGNSRHRETVSIDRFHDGMAWLAQITLFLMLGLLVAPHSLLRGLDAALALSLVLMFMARPFAVAICLLPFRFTWQEITFIGWVGLRGAVPIYLATIPILAGVPNATAYLNLAFVAVLTSLVLQGWSVAWSARMLGLELPPKPERPLRQELGLPGSGAELVIAAYDVAGEALATRRALTRLPLPADARILMAIRNGRALHAPELERLEPGDTVLVLGPAAGQDALDRIFGIRERPAEEAGAVFGEFTLEGSAPVKALASLYGLPVPEGAPQSSLAEFLAEKLGKEPIVGDRLSFGDVELVVQEVEDGTIRTVGIELEPEERRAHQIDPRRIRERLAGLIERLRSSLPSRRRQL
ncbi:MAG TPA: potassium/proton antiporter [Alphaproteobacteria bacterium]|nr:potassium/proton antiporter [Alphaproteobacteria bacterium]